MQWYYAVNNQRQGPIDQAELEKLVAEGMIKPDTLVWQQGMSDWKPYGTIAVTLPPSSPVGDDTAVCAVSGKRFPKREMIQYEGKWISAEHRDAFFQRMREGVADPSVDIVPGPFGYGGFGRRLVAKFIDSFIGRIVAMIIGFIVAAIFGGTGQLQAGNTTVILAMQGIILLLYFGFALSYDIFFIRKFDATPGKLAMGLKILRPDGSKLSVGRIIGRMFGQTLSGLILLIGYIMAAFDDERRALHDRICDTRVIKTR
jgi:uncharacterized RDD family membrane protein YckC